MFMGLAVSLAMQLTDRAEAIAAHVSTDAEGGNVDTVKVLGRSHRDDLVAAEGEDVTHLPAAGRRVSAEEGAPGPSRREGRGRAAKEL